MLIPLPNFYSPWIKKTHMHTLKVSTSAPHVLIQLKNHTRIEMWLKIQIWISNLRNFKMVRKGRRNVIEFFNSKSGREKGLLFLELHTLSLFLTFDFLALYIYRDFPLHFLKLRKKSERRVTLFVYNWIVFGFFFYPTLWLNITNYAE